MDNLINFAKQGLEKYQQSQQDDDKVNSGHQNNPQVGEGQYGHNSGQGQGYNSDQGQGYSNSGQGQGYNNSGQGQGYNSTGSQGYNQGVPGGEAQNFYNSGNQGYGQQGGEMNIQGELR